MLAEPGSPVIHSPPPFLSTWQLALTLALPLVAFGIILAEMGSNGSRGSESHGEFQGIQGQTLELGSVYNYWGGMKGNSTTPYRRVHRKRFQIDAIRKGEELSSDKDHGD
ncbi:unnamed protein product [Caretta caretta]